jgi:hypothetical protein
MGGRAIAKAFARADPAIHAFASTAFKTWMPGTRPGTTIQCIRKMIQHPSSDDIADQGMFHTAPITFSVRANAARTCKRCNPQIGAFGTCCRNRD